MKGGKGDSNGKRKRINFDRKVREDQRRKREEERATLLPQRSKPLSSGPTNVQKGFRKRRRSKLRRGSRETGNGNSIASIFHLFHIIHKKRMCLIKGNIAPPLGLTEMQSWGGRRVAGAISFVIGG